MLGHSCATILVRGADLVTVAAILGHARLETTRMYSKPTEEDHLRALELLRSTGSPDAAVSDIGR